MQVTHRFYDNGDDNDFAEYPTQFFTDSYYARPKGLRYPGGAGLAYEYNSSGHIVTEKDPMNFPQFKGTTRTGRTYSTALTWSAVAHARSATTQTAT